jgi:6-phosphogluconolactonase (cycloisomerase 2 family)
MSNELHVYIGTLTHPLPFAKESRGQGIVSCTLDPDTGRLEQRSVTGGILSPNFLAESEDGAELFAVTCNLEAGSDVQVFRREPGGGLTAGGIQPTDGRAGCHLIGLPGGGVCAVSYLDSSISIFPVSDGVLGPREYYFRYEGRSINAERQEDSHAHQVALSPDQRWLYVTDLGADCIWRHEIKDGRVIGGGPEKTTVPPGYGPRHLAFHPTLARAYVICELNSHVLTYMWQEETGGLDLLSDLRSMVPCDEVPAGAAIKVHPSGKALCVSNRNVNTLDFFTLDELGEPDGPMHVDCGGGCPRDFAIDSSGRWLLVGNQDSHSIAVHELSPSTGMPTFRPQQLFPVGSPACVLICGSPKA